MGLKEISACLGLLGCIGISSCTTKPTSSQVQAEVSPAPRIVNIINFIRQTDYRVVCCIRR